MHPDRTRNRDWFEHRRCRGGICCSAVASVMCLSDANGAAMAMRNFTPSQPCYTAMGLGATYGSRDSRWLVSAAASITQHGDAGVR